VEAIIAYSFDDKNLLHRALTAAAAYENDREGNRGIAQLGEQLIKTAIIDNSLTLGETRGNFQSTYVRLTQAAKKEHLAEVAKRWGLDNYIKFCPRQSGPSPAALSSAVRAIVGALWLDSRKDISAVAKVIEKLGL
ncbi:hypothetical protein AOQ84DRAFT_274498, partial [Glonium stellatum]